jgi:hypothetical protein
MYGEDWTPSEIQPAPKELLCQFRRRDGFSHTGYARDFMPEFNVAGLEWKLTGIGREELDRMPDKVKFQLFASNPVYLPSLPIPMLQRIMLGACGLIPGVDGMLL